MFGEKFDYYKDMEYQLMRSLRELHYDIFRMKEKINSINDISIENRITLRGIKYYLESIEEKKSKNKKKTSMEYLMEYAKNEKATQKYIDDEKKHIYQEQRENIKLDIDAYNSDWNIKG